MSVGAKLIARANLLSKMNCKVHYLCSGKYTAQNHNISWLTFQFILNKFLICDVQYILQGARRALLNFQLKFTALRWVDHLICHQFVCKRLHSAETVRACKTPTWRGELPLFLYLSDSANIYLISGFVSCLRFYSYELF